MNPAQPSLFHDTYEDAIRDTVMSLGGFKRTGAMLWPALPADDAGRKLSACLNTDKREKLDLCELRLIRHAARKAGVHILAAYEMRDAGYADPQPGRRAVNNPVIIGNATLYLGDCRESMRAMPEQSVHCCVTSPPYFGLRDYGHEGQLGLEETPEQFVANLLEVFREVRRVLRDDGTLWLNLGDSYARTGGKDRKVSDTAKVGSTRNTLKQMSDRTSTAPTGLKEKDLIGIPWRVAFALQADGWYLRQDIIWAKPNPMPESVTDRCTKSHEYLFLLSKSPRYYFDHEAIKEPVAATTVSRLMQNVDAQAGSDRVPGKTNGPMRAVRSKANSFKREGSKREQAIPGQSLGTHRPDRTESEYNLDTRNKRSVWNVATRPFSGAHFATFPPDLIEPCILAGCPIGGTVLDPFGGAGTTGLVATQNGRDAVLCEINPAYADMASNRISEAAEESRSRIEDAQRQSRMFA